MSVHPNNNINTGQPLDGHSGNVPLNNNNNNNNNDIHNNNSRFSSLETSPYLSDTSNMITLASLNVRGINTNTKFDNILEDLIGRQLSVIGLQETKLSEDRARSLFTALNKRTSSLSSYNAYWSFDPQDRAAGVGLIIASFISKYVQRVHRHKGRFIAIDLLLPAKKLKFINVYIPPADSYNTKGKDIVKSIIDHITEFTLQDRKSTRLNSSHDQISYAVFCLKKKNTHEINSQDAELANTVRIHHKKPYARYAVTSPEHDPLTFGRPNRRQATVLHHSFAPPIC